MYTVWSPDNSKPSPPYIPHPHHTSLVHSKAAHPYQVDLILSYARVNLPPDVMVGGPPRQEHHYACTTEYVEWVRQSILTVHEFARKQLGVAAKRQKANYDQTGRPCMYKKGQYVWRYYPPSARRKLGKEWTGPYRILSCPTDIHCDIALSPESQSIRVHVDHIKPHLDRVLPVWVGYETSTCMEDSEGYSGDTERDTGRDGEEDSPHEVSQVSTSDAPDSSARSLPCPTPLVQKSPKHDLVGRRSRRAHKAPDRLDL
jgi:hypothetical protein